MKNKPLKLERPSKKASPGEVSRPGWDEYFLEMAYLASRRSTCIRRKVGVVIVKDKHVLSTGYNGAPHGLAHASEVGCLREKLGIPSGERHEICRGLHGEQNAIIQAAYHGVSINGSVIYSTTMPCVICFKMILNSGISRVYYAEGYPDDLTLEFMKESGLEVVQLQREDET